MNVLVEELRNGVWWLGLRIGDRTIWIKPIALAGECRRPGTGSLS